MLSYCGPSWPLAPINNYICHTLYVIIESAVFISIFLQDSVSVLISKILKLNESILTPPETINKYVNIKALCKDGSVGGKNK